MGLQKEEAAEARKDRFRTKTAKRIRERITKGQRMERERERIAIH